MSEATLFSYRHAGEVLGIDERAVSSMVSAIGLTPKRMRSNGAAKCLDRSDLEVLRARLRPAQPDEAEHLAGTST